MLSSAIPRLSPRLVRMYLAKPGSQIDVDELAQGMFVIGHANALEGAVLANPAYRDRRSDACRF